MTTNLQTQTQQEIAKLGECGITLKTCDINKTSDSISIYGDEKATKEDAKEALTFITASFPSIFQKMDDASLKIFGSMFIKSVAYCSMSKQQLSDAVMNCICHKHQYGQFQISDITDYDVKFKLYNHNEVAHLSGFDIVELNGFYFDVSLAELASQGYKVKDKKIVKADGKL